MQRFLRHPLHRTALIILTSAAVLGYFLPALITRPGILNGTMVAIAILVPAAYAWVTLKARAARRSGSDT